MDITLLCAGVLVWFDGAPEFSMHHHDALWHTHAVGEKENSRGPSPVQNQSDRQTTLQIASCRLQFCRAMC